MQDEPALAPPPVDDDALDALIEEHVADAVAEEDRRPWHIETIEQAEWAMRKLAQARKELDEVEAQRDVWEQRVEEWARRARARAERTERFMSDRLADYARRRREETGRNSLIVPSGTVETRLHRAVPVVQDDEAVLRWAQDNLGDDYDNVIETRRKLRVMELRRRLTVRDGRVVTEDGEVVPGLRVSEQHVSVSIHPF